MGIPVFHKYSSGILALKSWTIYMYLSILRQSFFIITSGVDYHQYLQRKNFKDILQITFSYKTFLFVFFDIKYNISKLIDENKGIPEVW